MSQIYFPEDQHEFFKRLRGKFIIDVRGMYKGSNHVSVLFDDGSAIKFYHSQNCCETVELDDVWGDPEDLKNSELYEIELVTSKDRPRDKYDSSYTWSFYKFKTSRGYVDLRWYGASNGYYSETVNIEYYQPKYDENWEDRFEN